MASMRYVGGGAVLSKRAFTFGSRDSLHFADKYAGRFLVGVG
jgi:hypothetical protein